MISHQAGVFERRQRSASLIRVANAPCSWGVLEFESRAASPAYSRVLDEIAESGYSGTELGDWGFLPTEPGILRDEIERRALALVAAFVTTRLADPSAQESTLRKALGIARLLAAVSGTSPIIVLSDEPAANPARAREAGRIQPSRSLSDEQWDNAARSVEHLARAVRDDTGLRTVFHHHCATHVETAGEIDALLQRTGESLVGLCLDSGHIAYAGGSPLDLLARYGARTWHVHFKDCDPYVAARARQQGWDYRTAVRQGLFCELGQGEIDFPALLEALHERRYAGWIVVEQDVLPSTGSPFESAKRNRAYLRALGV
jgi:inosose dehydratase